METALTRSIPDEGDNALRVEVRFKNARLFNRIRAYTAVGATIRQTTHSLACQSHNGLVAEFCRQHGLNGRDQQNIYQLLSLKRPPRNRLNGDWLDIAVRLSGLLECELDWLFPDELYQGDWRPMAQEGDPRHFEKFTQMQQTLAPVQVALLADKDLEAIMASCLHTLSPREQRVLELRFGIGCEPHDLNAVADSFAVTRERIRQIEAKALRKLRHPSRSRRLKPFIIEHADVDKRHLFTEIPDEVRWTPLLGKIVKHIQKFERLQFVRPLRSEESVRLRTWRKRFARVLAVSPKRIEEEGMTVVQARNGAWIAYIPGLPVYAEAASPSYAQHKFRDLLKAYLEAHPDTPEKWHRLLDA